MDKSDIISICDEEELVRDVEHRKAKNLDRADILTEHTTDADCKVTITHRAIKEK